jgi:hypothetical protein
VIYKTTLALSQTAQRRIKIDARVINLKKCGRKLRWLPCRGSGGQSPASTAKIRVRAQVSSRGICGRQSGTGAGFLRVLWFPLPSIPPIAPQLSSSSSSIIIRSWYSRPVMASIIVDAVPLHDKKGKKKSVVTKILAQSRNLRGEKKIHE